MQTEELIKELPKGLIKWYDFREGSRALCVMHEQEIQKSIAEALEECNLQVDKIFLNELECETNIMESSSYQHRMYDYIVMVGVLAFAKNPISILQTLQMKLTDGGRLLLGEENRLAIRYFCGDRDPFTERNFDGIEDYKRINPADQRKLQGRLYAKAELNEMLEQAGFYSHQYYSVFPELSAPQILLADDYVPQEELGIRIFPQYHYPDTVFLEEENLYTTLLKNGLFHTMANGFLIECFTEIAQNTRGLDADRNMRANQITVSMDRGRKNAMYTIIRKNRKNGRDGIVEKRPVYTEGMEKLQNLMENHRYLSSQGIRMIDEQLKEHAVVMPFVQGIPMIEYFRNLLLENQELFLQQFDKLWTMILKSSDHVPYEEIDWENFEPWCENRKKDDPNKDRWKKIAFGTEEEQDCFGVVLKRGYIDLVMVNGFVVENDFIFYDQELYLKNLPAKAILLRNIDFIYEKDNRMEQILPRKYLLKRYKMDLCLDLYYSYIGYFLNRLRNDKELSVYHKSVRRDNGVVHSNRQRMNYSTDEYERLFRDIFKGTEGRQLYVFGSGNFTKKFLSQFGNDYSVTGIIDNNSDKWGTDLQGIPIYSPEYLKSLPIGSYKVIICIKNYVPVMKQLKKMGVRDFSIYDSNLKYPRKQPMSLLTQTDDCDNYDKNHKKHQKQPKKYHVGYIAGVFDLFHIGHLNMFKRAKEQCDYLIVGVVNDESVMKNKKTMPMIPFEERLEIVRSCQYVDEAVEIPTEYNDTDEAYRRYQFDVQFSGSDYENDPDWLAKKAFLQKQGSDMVFFPYTQSTSSTKLKELIQKKLS